MSGTLSHTPSQVVRQLLIDQGLAFNGGATWPVYAVQLTNAPDNAIGVFDRAGVQRGRFQVGGEIQEVHGIQIIVRASDAQTGFVKANAIKIALAGSVHLTTVSVTDPDGYGTGTQSYAIFNITHKSGPFSIAVEGTDRKDHSLNMIVTLREN